MEERTLRQYEEVYDAYFDERDLIPAGRLHEMRLRILEADPIGELRKLYAALDLPDFAVAEPAIRDYLDFDRRLREEPFHRRAAPLEGRSRPPLAAVL